jgi:hypothetical protein
MSRGTHHPRKLDAANSGRTGSFFILISDEHDHPKGPVGLCTHCCQKWVTGDRWLKEVKGLYDPSMCSCFECGEQFEHIEIDR